MLRGSSAQRGLSRAVLPGIPSLGYSMPASIPPYYAPWVHPAVHAQVYATNTMLSHTENNSFLPHTDGEAGQRFFLLHRF